jgi:tyrosine-protein kinase Etk/Wzc
LADDIDSKEKPVADDVAGREFQLSSEESDEASMLDLLLILSARKHLILVLTLVGGLLATALAFLVPPTYTASAIIMPPQQQSSSAAALIQQLGGVAGLAGQSLGIKNPSDPYIGILSSRTVADELVAKFGLRDVYRKKYLTDTRKALASRTSIISTKYSLIQISVEDRIPKRAADLANAYVEKLQEQTSRLAVTEASKRRLFFERQVEIEKRNLAEAELSLKRTQEQKGIYQVTSQVEAVIRSIAQMRAEISAREVNLQRLKAGATMQNPEVLRQEIELKALRSQFQELEASSTKKSPGDPLVPTTMVPAAGLEYARRLREVKYRETLFELLAKQYEAARIDEAKEAPVIQVVDSAIPPDKKTAPVRRLYVVAGSFLGGLLGLALVLFQYAVQDPIRAKKMSALKESLWIHRNQGRH